MGKNLSSKGRYLKMAGKSVVVAYARVSTDEQVRDGVSLAAQESRLRAFALATGRDNVEVVRDEGQSAKTLVRPGLRGILARVRRGEIEALLVLKLDRLTRSVRDLADLLEIFSVAGTALVSVTESLDTSTASGRLMLNLLASVSQWEREAIGERTAFALAHKRRNRKVYGPTPFGYRRRGDTLLEEPNELSALATVVALRQGGASLRDLCEHLESRGIKPPRGYKWHPGSLSAILKSKMTTAS